jgi:hypothetical protein
MSHLNLRMRLFRARTLLMSLLLSFALPSALAAQYTVEVHVRDVDLTRGTPLVCVYHTTLNTEPPDPDRPGRLHRIADTLRVRVVNAQGSTTKAPAALRAQVGAGEIHSLTVDDTARTFPLEPRALTAQQVRVMRAREVGAANLCIARPVEPAVTARDLTVTHHDLFAGGEVSSALRTGAAGGAASGNLGLHSFVYRDARRPFRFPFGILSGIPRIGPALRDYASYNVHLEELRASITVLSGTDTLFAVDDSREFAQAVLSPLTATRGNLSAVQVMYSPQQYYGVGTAMRGFRFAGGATRSVWKGAIASRVRNPNASAEALDTLAKDVTLFAADARYRWTFINHQTAEDGNVFSFAMDGGLAYRSIAGDLGTNRSPEAQALRRATLGTDKKIFLGPVIGMAIALRRVTAFAELHRFWGLRGEDIGNVEQLEGWQPLVGFRFEAPMFTIRDAAR